MEEISGRLECLRDDNFSKDRESRGSCPTCSTKLSRRHTRQVVNLSHLIRTRIAFLYRQSTPVLLKKRTAAVIPTMLNAGLERTVDANTALGPPGDVWHDGFKRPLKRLELCLELQVLAEMHLFLTTSSYRQVQPSSITLPQASSKVAPESKMADWEDATLSSRHMHNRVGKQGRGKGGKSGGAFNVQKTFGTFEVKCPAATKLASSDTENTQTAKLEVYTLNDDGNALLAELFLPGVLHATVLLAGSRKTMSSVVRGFEAETAAQDEVEVDASANASRSELDDSGESEGEHESQADDDPADRRAREFEKNSFRSPKFWMRWQGELLQSSPNGHGSNSITDSGYVVFSGNNCDKFQGTISCEQLDWKNVKIDGWKTASRSARDFAVAWQKESG